MINIAFIGVGGVGGYFGGKMTKILKERGSEVNLYFVARGEHFKVIKEGGLTLKTKNEGILLCKPTKVVEYIDELPNIDICFISVKQYDLNEVLEKLKDKMKDTTKIIPLLNGVDIYNRIREVIKIGVVFPSCVYVGTHIESAGVVEQAGGSCEIIFGRDPNNEEIVADDICKIMDECEIKYSWNKKTIEEIWSKFMFIAAYGIVTAYKNKTIGEILEDEENSLEVVGIMKEIFEISKMENVKLLDDIIDKSYRKAREFPYNTKTSFQRDFEKINKPDERELFGKSIIELGEKHGVNVDLTKNAYKIINGLKRN